MTTADTFVAGWKSYGNPVSYIYSLYYQNPQDLAPWIIEEDTVGHGSRIAIHDSTMFDADYNDEYDATMQHNFMFVHNLCTVFPQ